MSTRWDGKRRGLGEPAQRQAALRGRGDPALEVAIVARARRELLIGVHRHRLRREDLEDCYSQATLELLVAVGRGRVFASRLHLARALEQRFVSRVQDRRRAISGRSPMEAALEQASALGGGAAGTCERIADPRAEPEKLALARHELAQIRALAPQLTVEQRLVLATQVGLGMPPGDFCRVYAWSPEKYRKVAQRARRHLRQLVALDDASVPPGSDGRNSEQGPTYEINSPHP